MNEAMHIEPFFHDATGTWSYVVHRGIDAVVIDPVLDYDAAAGTVSTGGADKILSYLAQQQFTLQWILETHAHADHLSAFLQPTELHAIRCRPYRYWALH